MKQPNSIDKKLLQEWNWARNTIHPDNVTRGSGLVVWWNCKKGHEWQAKVYSRSHGRNCPYCSGRKVNEQNCLTTVSPEIAKEWHYEKNFPLRPEEVTSGSKKKIWWECKKGHLWRCVVYDRKKGNCPFCSGKRASKDRNFEKSFPALVKEWDKKKNGSNHPSKYSPYSNKKVWWKCKKNHVWEAAISDRSRGRGCPRCNSQSSNIEFRVLSEILYIFPNAVHRKIIDNIEIDIYIPQINVGIEIDGYPWHKNKKLKDIRKASELRKKGIFLVKVRDDRLADISTEDIKYSERQVNLALIKKIISLMKDSGRFNELQLELFNEHSRTKIFINDDIYKKFVANKIYASPESSLSTVLPQKASLWDQNKNGELYPEDVAAFSHVKVWWKCPKGHEWEEWVYKVSGITTPCPVCRKLKFIEEKSLKVNSTFLLKEWDYEKNTFISPEDVSCFSNMKVWWKCSFGHSWQAQISNRSRGAGCPYCNNKKVNSSSSLHMLRSDLMQEWDYQKNKNLDPKKISQYSHKKAWWLCSQGHSWFAEIANRSCGTGCPECWKIRRGKKKPNNCIKRDFQH